MAGKGAREYVGEWKRVEITLQLLRRSALFGSDEHLKVVR